ncbi:MAG: SDR family NAD(P)-dependent oxidoreductase [Acidobacteriaceae bacterium]
MALRELKRAAAVGFVLAGAGVVCTGAVAFLAVGKCRKKSTSLHGKTVLITGASRGLGLAMAEEFGKAGARLVLVARDMAALERARWLLLRRRAADGPEDILLLSGDLREPEDAERLIQQATDHFGAIDVLVNNAGVITVGPVENQTIQDFRDVMDSNFFSGVHCALAVLPQMLARGRGSIVNITSIGGKIAVPHMLPYTASKFAAVGFSEGLNAELRSRGVRVTTVCPGLMRTGSHLNAVFTGDAEREYRWFSVVAGLPGVSTSARSAARKIVRATIAGKSEIAITPQAMLAARLGNLSPTATMRAMQLVKAALPSAVPGPAENFRGAEVRGREVKRAVFLAHAAARRYNQSE